MFSQFAHNTDWLMFETLQKKEEPPTQIYLIPGKQIQARAFPATDFLEMGSERMKWV